MATKFSFGGFLVRALAAFGLVGASYNPITPYSFYEWALVPALQDVSNVTVLHGFIGVVLLIGWVVFLTATSRSLGFFGVVLATAFFAMLIWLLVDKGLVSLDSGNAFKWAVMVAISAILATGLSWSHVRRRLSGQIDVDETDDH